MYNTYVYTSQKAIICYYYSTYVGIHIFNGHARCFLFLGIEIFPLISIR